MTVHIFETMGTTASLRFAGALPSAATLAAVEACFDRFDGRYSLYRPDSEISRVAAGDLALYRASAELRENYAEALDWRGRTSGAFTPHRPDGVIDLNGLIKAKAMAASAVVLVAAGSTDWLLNVGGDILSSGSTVGGSPWSVGIVDPLDAAGMLCAVPLAPGRRAIATSGTAERGEHIWRRDVAGQGAEPAYSQVSVLAADIVTADVLATAILAGGRAQLTSALAQFDIEVLTVDASGGLTATAGLRSGRGLVRA